jgi:DNA-binding transcriptional LysR family regulator
MLWLGASEGLIAGGQDDLPLALLDPPCGFRAAAIAALDAAGRPYRIAATSPSLSGLRAAVRAGIAVTVRTARWLGDGVSDLSRPLALPAVGQAEFTVRLRSEAGGASTDLATLVCDGLDAAKAAT